MTEVFNSLWTVSMEYAIAYFTRQCCSRATTLLLFSNNSSSIIVSKNSILILSIGLLALRARWTSDYNLPQKVSVRLPELVGPADPFRTKLKQLISICQRVRQTNPAECLSKMDSYIAELSDLSTINPGRPRTTAEHQPRFVSNTILPSRSDSKFD